MREQIFGFRTTDVRLCENRQGAKATLDGSPLKSIPPLFFAQSDARAQRARTLIAIVIVIVIASSAFEKSLLFRFQKLGYKFRGTILKFVTR